MDLVTCQQGVFQWEEREWIERGGGGSRFFKRTRRRSFGRRERRLLMIQLRFLELVSLYIKKNGSLKFVDIMEHQEDIDM